MSFVRRVGQGVLAAPRAVVGVVGVAALAAAVAAALGLEVRPGYVDLLSPDSPAQARYLSLLREMGNVEALYLSVESSTEDSAARFVDELVPALRGLRGDDGRNAASSVVGGVDLAWFADRLPAYAPASLVESLAAELEDPARDDLRALVRNPAPDALVAAVRRSVEGALDEGSASGAPVASDTTSLSMLRGLLEQVERAAQGARVSAAALLPALGAGSEGRLDAAGHLRLAPGRLLVTVAPSDVSNDYQVLAPFLGSVRRVVEDLRKRYPDVRVLTTGAPPLLVDEMNAVRRDIAVSSVLSFLLVWLLFALSFNSPRLLVFAVISNLVGLALTFGAAWLLVGYLNLFSSVFAAVLAGLGIDFGIHIVNHYESLRRLGHDARESLLASFEVLGPPTAVSAVTTAAAFFMLMTSGFRGFSQLGLIAGVGVLLCLASTFTLLPAMILLDARRRDAQRADAASQPTPPHPWSTHLLAWPSRHAVATTAVGAVVLAAAALGATKLQFDYNLLHLQPGGTQAVALQESEERRLSTHQGFSIATSVEQARELEGRLAALPSVASVRSAAAFLPAPDPQRERALGALSDALSSALSASVERAEVDPARVASELTALESSLVTAQDLAFEGGRAELVGELEDLIAAAAAAREATALPAAAAGLTALRDEMALQVGRIASLLPALAARELAPGDLPEGLRGVLVGRTGLLPVISEPSRPVWNRADLERFVADLRSVDPQVSGPPVQILDVTSTMKRSLELASLAAFVAILVLVTLGMRSLKGMLLAVAPLAAGFLLTLGLLPLLDLQLNPANLVALPLLLGLGVDAGVHVAARWLVLRDASSAVFEVGHAVLVTSLTTVAGFAGLLLASHRGLRSLGVVACVGSCAMTLTTIVLLPACLAVGQRWLRGTRVASSPGSVREPPA